MSNLWKASFGWGILLWMIGYILGIVLVMAKISTSVVGWIIMPIGVLIILWILIKKVNFEKFTNYLILGVIWTILAIGLDYFLLVKLFKPADGYYKLDVYLYYALTFLLPLVVGYFKRIKDTKA